jgi:hypothetical protein
MKRDRGIARCGLACCLCAENSRCAGCGNDACPDRDWCENRKCSIEKGLSGCWQCEEDCRRGVLYKIKPYGFLQFIKRYGLEHLLDRLEQNEKNGVVYHRSGIQGDYDDFEDTESLLRFLESGRR